jgi:hypothetical protein
MGQKKERLLKFLAAHPTCCFCGGVSPAASRDHLPPRSVFVSHKTPEEYAFPACIKCNNGSSGDDSIVALISRMGGGRDVPQAEQAEWLKLLRAFNERHPGEAQKGILTANEKRKALRAHNISVPDGVGYAQLPLVKFSPIMHEAVLRIGRKLTLALHYKHTGKIVPADAWVDVSWRTNVHKLANEIPKEIFETFSNSVELHRDRKSLGDQFSYTYAVSDNGEVGGYVASFRKIFLVIGMVVFDTAAMRDVDHADFEKSVDKNVGVAR